MWFMLGLLIGTIIGVSFHAVLAIPMNKALNWIKAVIDRRKTKV